MLRHYNKEEFNPADYIDELSKKLKDSGIDINVEELVCDTIDEDLIKKMSMLSHKRHFQVINLMNW